MSLALIAGTGALPQILFQDLVDRGEPPIVCAMKGFEPAIRPDIRFRLEHLGSFLSLLKEEGVSQICLAGAVKRPTLDPTEINAATAPLIPRLQAAMALGDDGALRGIIALFEEQGFSVVGAADLMPGLLPKAGIPTIAQPLTPHNLDVRLGIEALAEMGAKDIGQSCVIKDQTVLASEGQSGTDAMMAGFLRPVASDKESTIWPLDLAGDMVSQAADWLSGEGRDARGGILYKAPKPGQELRADMPVIGPDTATRAAAIGLAGIVIKAGGVMVLDHSKVLRILDTHGLFLWVRE